MQPIAAWLVARPLHGGIGLAVSLLVAPVLPLFLLVSGMVMVHIVLASGVRMAIIEGVCAGLALALIAPLLGMPLSQMVANAVIAWVPIVVLAGVARGLRSLTLTFQVSVIVAAASVASFFLVLGDPTYYWNDVIMESIALFNEAGATDYADWLTRSQSVIVPQMTMLFVFVGWSMFTFVFLMGYMLYQNLPGKSAVFGRFCDLNLGRILAGVMAVTSVLAVLTGSAWLQNVAFLILVTFWLQGLSIMHWLSAEKNLPALVLIGTYILMVPLIGILMIAFSVLGYLDAWFNFRARNIAKQV